MRKITYRTGDTSINETVAILNDNEDMCHAVVGRIKKYQYCGNEFEKIYVVRFIDENGDSIRTRRVTNSLIEAQNMIEEWWRR